MSIKQGKKTIDVGNKLVESLYTPEKLRGTKWNHVSTGRTGFNTILDKDIIKRHLDREKQNMGQGFLRLTVPGYDGTKPSPINIGGRLMYPQENGKGGYDVVIVDNGVVKKMKEMEEEKRKYLEELIETCSLSDEIMALTLGLNGVDDLKALIGAGQNMGGEISDTELVQVDATPSSIETMDPTGQTYSKALQKFKICLRHFMPVLDDLTPAKTINQEA